MPIYKVQNEIDGEKITMYIEMEAIPSAKSTYGNTRGVTETAKQVIETSRDVFDDAMELVKSCAMRVMDSAKTMDDATRPDEFELEFAIKFDSEVGAILAKMGSEAQLKVSMKWKREETTKQT